MRVIECMTTEPDTTRSAKVLRDFLTAALPNIEQCMPEWKKGE